MIPFNNVVFIAQPEEMDEDTGFLKKGTYSGQSARVSFGATKTVNTEGEEVVAEAKIYLPAGSNIGINHKLKFQDTDESREFNIIRLEYKQDVKGKIDHVAIWV